MNKKNILNYLREAQAEKVLYLFGWIILFLLISYLGLKKIFPDYFKIISFPCVWRTVFNIYCPGCGGTRSLHFLLRGKLLQSIYYHPLVPYGILISCLFMISHTVSYITKGKISGMKFRVVYIYLAVIILVTQFLIKNLLLIVWNTEMIS